jgi:hypothetical protein
MATKVFNFTTYQEPPTIVSNTEYLKFDKLNDMTIGEDDKTVKYEEKMLKKTMYNHWGQFKLLISEIMFLTYYWNPKEVPKPIVVYPGSAAGHHIYVLSQLFETVQFHLYDKHPNKKSAFDPRLIERPNITIFDKYFEDEEIKKYKLRNDIFFISDIRNLSYGGENKDESEQVAYQDLMLQRKWIITIRPVKAMLKLRLPWKFDQPSCSMLGGVAYKQPFAPSTSTELRLVCNEEYSDENYNYKKVEEIMAYHNTVTRAALFLNPLTLKEEPICPEYGFYNDWDSCYSTIIAMDYLTKFNIPTTKNNVISFLVYLQGHTSKSNMNEIRKGKDTE